MLSQKWHYWLFLIKTLKKLFHITTVSRMTIQNTLQVWAWLYSVQNGMKILHFLWWNFSYVEHVIFVFNTKISAFLYFYLVSWTRSNTLVFETFSPKELHWSIPFFKEKNKSGSGTPIADKFTWTISKYKMENCTIVS